VVYEILFGAHEKELKVEQFSNGISNMIIAIKRFHIWVRTYLFVLCTVRCVLP